jgi:hypothetical protein
VRAARAERDVRHVKVTRWTIAQWVAAAMVPVERGHDFELLVTGAHAGVASPVATRRLPIRGTPAERTSGAPGD